MTLEEFKNKVFTERPEVKAAYEKLEPEYERLRDFQKETQKSS